ncbi:MAG: DUF2155 domain-containing protein [Nitrospirae bacterium]|nr:DUF2155 domain-containing protein [Nitrospirota bacterium]MBF0536365.1 DUF2155 domain-containing protein [Nitrospirota bacterium]MBF0616596.1 DUF2155 domain-containing protein [Nitrospirota bacterium]
MLKGLGIFVYAFFIMGLFVTSCTKNKEIASEVPKNPENYLVTQSAHQSTEQAGVSNPHGKNDLKSQGEGGTKDKEKHKMEIVVPDDVKNTWESVKIMIADKKTNKSETADIKLNTEYKVNGSDIVIKVGQFIPDFRMDSITITSVSNEPNNPAVNVTISEGGKEIFTGWLYSKYPDIHPFEHTKYAVRLVEGVRKK